MGRDSGAVSNLKRVGQVYGERRAGPVLKSCFHLNMPRPDAVEALADDAMGQFGAIAIAAQVGQVNPLQFSRNNLLRKLRRRVVREMAVSAQDALLDAPRSLRIVLQELQVVIGFEQEDVRRAHPFDNQLGGVAKVTATGASAAALPDITGSETVLVMVGAFLLLCAAGAWALLRASHRERTH